MSTTFPQWDPTRLAAELKWLQQHPEFEERPASIREFIGKDYLNIEERVRPAVLAELEEIIGKKVKADRITAYAKAIFTGAIGIGKTTIASIVLPYLAHWVLCLKDPQGFFNLLPGSRIAFMQMSTSGKQAKEVVFGDIKARVEYSPWFQQKHPFDPKFKNQLRFDKEVWILPGDSEETTFEGYNILGGILDEADSHQVTDTKDYAEQGYTTISSRVASRFQDRGFVLIIGQMKRANGFAARKYKEFKRDPEAYAVRMTIWESFGWDQYLAPDGSRDSFWYDSDRNEIVPEGTAIMVGSDNLIEVPNMYKQEFINNPTKALRDLAGIPPATGSPFISLVYKITEARDRWHLLYDVKNGPIEKPHKYLPDIADWFQAPDRVKRACHIDMAYSASGDGLGLAMGHVHEMIEIEGETKPFIVYDLVCRVHAPEGREIFLGDIRRIIYDLRGDRHFKIDVVTMDGFQSVDTRQQLERRKIFTEIVSVDKQTAPYEDLREAIYENRIAFPKYMVRLRDDDTELTEIVVKELMELVDNGNKIDHPEGGSKDVADAMAGVCYTLMGDRSYHRRQATTPLTSAPGSPQGMPGQRQGISHPALLDPGGLRAPVPPSIGGQGPVWQPPRR